MTSAKNDVDCKIVDPLKRFQWLNRQNLVCHLGAAAGKVRSEISSVVKGKLLCLKIDSATRLGRHILGVNIQFYDTMKKDIVIYTIGSMLELNNRHTGIFLKSKILEILALYNVSLEQIFTVTCDTGANMIAAVKQLQSELQTLFNTPTEDDGCTIPDEQLEWTESVEREFSHTITVVRQHVHTMQLSVSDVIKAYNVELRKYLMEQWQFVKEYVEAFELVYILQVELAER
ncbi:uncharacterized protein LOC120905695, partial [Anopheles arabiensis]|uniref:uncharacterized protein LOC120905695 n=1 Tax=Anopheles arabiensis TaxID=7173 RepID=UPI001AAC802B